MLLGNGFESANAGADEHAAVVGIYLVKVESGIPYGLPGGIDAKLGKAIRAPHILGRGNAGATSRSLTSAAIWVSNAAASKAVILSMPQQPAVRFDQNVSRSFPTGETTPNPVITTRRSVDWFP